MYKLRKIIEMSADGGAWNWQRVFIQDTNILARTSDGVRVYRDADDLLLPAIVEQFDADGLDLNVLLPNPLRGITQTIRVEIDPDNATPATNFATFGTSAAATTSAIGDDYTVYDEEDGGGNAEANCTEFVHPFAVKVPAGSWASHLDGTYSGEVTHIIVDTPYPGSPAAGQQADYENPVLFYSDDDCATRAPVPSSAIPWPLDGVPASGSNKDVCAFFQPVSGDLIITWKNPVDEAKFARIQGSNLTDAVVAEVWNNASVNANVDDDFIVSNTYIPLSRTSDNRVRCYFTSPSPNDNDGCGCVYYRDTENFEDGADATWTAETQISWAGGEYDRGWWHGGIMHDGVGQPFYDGYYYLAYTEGLSGAVATFGAGGSNVRVWRSKEIDGPWEPALDFLIEGGASLAASGVYQVSLTETAAGSPLAVYSMRDALGDYAVGSSSVNLDDTTIAEAAAFNTGWGSSSAYATSSPLLAAIDFRRNTLVDASGNGNDATLTGSPTQAEGVGVTLDGDTQRIVIGASDLLGGEGVVDIGGLFTFPETFETGSSSGCLFDDNPDATGSFQYGLRLRVNPSTGRIGDYFWHNGSVAVGATADIGPDLRGGTHFIRAIFDAGQGFAKLAVDGVTISTLSVSGTIRALAAKRLQIGAYNDLDNELDMTVHYFYVRTGCDVDFSAFRPGYGHAYPVLANQIAADSDSPSVSGIYGG